MDNYEKIADRLSSRGSQPGLETITELLRRLGDPQNDLPVIHIAGTNGKGSTGSFIASILMEAGFRVGRTMSPMIECYRDQFRINDTLISEPDLDRLFRRIDEAGRQMEEDGLAGPTLFEAETALALLYFQENHVDYALVETGMGGLYDATNVFDRPLAAVITSISMDHMAFLGDRIEDIAAHKAGIIRPGCPVILAENPEKVKEVVRKTAGREGAPLNIVSEQDYQIVEETPEGGAFTWKGQLFHVSMPGRHQISNAVTALMTVSVLLPELAEKDIDILRSGLEKTRLPGRMERICKNPVIYRDGAHNPDGVSRLVSFVEKHFTNRRIVYIIGILKDKDYELMMQMLVPTGQAFYVFRPDNPRGLDAEKLTETIRHYSKAGQDIHPCRDVNMALTKALQDESHDGSVFIVCGSLSFMRDMDGDLVKKVIRTCR